MLNRSTGFVKTGSAVPGHAGHLRHVYLPAGEAQGSKTNETDPSQDGYLKEETE